MEKNNLEKFLENEYSNLLEEHEKITSIDNKVKANKDFYNVFYDFRKELEKENLAEKYQKYLMDIESLKTSNINEYGYYFYIEGFKKALEFLKDIEKLNEKIL